MAVNADKDGEYLKRPGTQRPFFRHANGKQQFSCLIRAARAAAMQMLMEQDYVTLPSQRYQAYDGEAFEHLSPMHAPEIVTVAARRWIDSFHGVLVLSDGREILLTAHVDSELTQSGGFERVIRIDCDDPLVATMSPQEILDALRAPDGSMLCWQKHEDDERLQQEAVELANEYLAGIPPELLAGLSRLHANETILHWLIKEAVRKNPLMRVPHLRGSLQSQRYKQVVVDFELPALVLEILEPSLEKWMGSIVPDVVCKARVRGSSDEPFDLLIEAAVTHKADEDKLKKVRDQGFSAIEIRSDLFKRVGMIKASVIEHDVCNDPSNKVWLHHPMYLAKIAEAQRELSARERLILQQERQRLALVTWLKDAKTGALYRLAYGYLAASWDGRPPPRDPHPGVTLETVREELSKRKDHDFKSLWLSGQSGLLGATRTVQNSAMGHVTSIPMHELLARSKVVPFGEKSLGVYLLLAIECWQPYLTKQECEAADELRSAMEASFKSGSHRHCRSRQYDTLLSQIYPDLVPLLSGEFGTVSYANSLRAQMVEIETRMKNLADAEAEVLYKEELRRQDEVREREKACQREKEIEAVIDAASRVWVWSPVSALTSTQQAALKLAVKMTTVTAVGVDLERLVLVGWRARVEGRSIGDALRELQVQDADEVSFATTTWTKILMARRALT